MKKYMLFIITLIMMTNTTYGMQNDEMYYEEKINEITSDYEGRYTPLSETDRIFVHMTNRFLADASSKMWDKYFLGGEIDKNSIYNSLNTAKDFLGEVQNKYNYHIVTSRTSLNELFDLMNDDLAFVSTNAIYSRSRLYKVKYRTLNQILVNSSQKLEIPIGMNKLSLESVEELYGIDTPYLNTPVTKNEYVMKVYAKVYQSVIPPLDLRNFTELETDSISLRVIAQESANIITYLNHQMGELIWLGDLRSNTKCRESVDKFKKYLKEADLNEIELVTGLSIANKAVDLVSELETIHLVYNSISVDTITNFKDTIHSIYDYVETILMIN